MVEIQKLTGGYGKRRVLENVSMCARAGEITAVLGPNGCGKSTLLKTICGILPPASGQVLLDGQPLAALDAGEIAQKVAYLPQNRQVPDITVGRLVLHGRFPYLSYPRRYRQADYEAARRAMEQLGIEKLADKPLPQLSGGQQQKAYIAMALAQDTEVILLDEPTTYLDVAHQLQLLHLARALADAGKHVILILHDIPHALENAHHIVLMRDGTVVMEGTPEAVFESGALEDTFGIHVARVELEGKRRYLCMEQQDAF